MMMLTRQEVRAVADYAQDVWRAEHRKRRRRPQPHELVTAIYGSALEIVNREVGRNTFLYLGAPRHVRCALAEVSSGAAREAQHLSDTALNVIAYFDNAGDHPNPKNANSIEIDRRIMRLAAAEYFRTGAANHSAIGRQLGLVTPASATASLHGRQGSWRRCKTMPRASGAPKAHGMPFAERCGRAPTPNPF